MDEEIQLFGEKIILYTKLNTKKIMVLNVKKSLKRK